jgi:hypothetical protein
MTPKAKAFHLHFKFIRDVIADSDKAKQCALITVDEILDTGCLGSLMFKYWEEVKQEIINL